MKQQARLADWRQRFLSLAALPMHASKVYRKKAEGETKEIETYQSVLNEADLFGAIYKSSSFLLLGDPGAGKTTCLQELVEELASTGARTPVFLALNRYEGNLLRNLGEVLCDEAHPLAEQEVERLLSSGALTVILDGLNEVQSRSLQPQLVKEINALTKPEAPTARSQWIASSRRYDYTYVPQLIYLDRYTWELLPLDSSLIYEFLAKELGTQEGATAYFSLDPGMREVCSNPLLLNMLLSVYKVRGKLSPNRGALYHQFVDLLLRKGAEQPWYQKELDSLSTLLRSHLTLERYCDLAHSVLPDLAMEMQNKGTLILGTNEAIDVFKRHHSALIAGLLPEQAATKLSQVLLHQGVLKYTSGKIVFFHHTFQEYFWAVKLKELPLDQLIPRKGVHGALREAIIFMASTLGASDTLQNLIGHALSSGNDMDLAYEIMRSASIPVSKAVQLKIAHSLVKRVFESGLYVGANKRSAQMVAEIAASLLQSVEQLLRDVLHPRNEAEFTPYLLRFHQELGDLTAQQRVLKNVVSQEDTPNDMVFQRAVTASNSGNQRKAIELYTQYIMKNPNHAPAYSNRADAYKTVGDWKHAEEDYKHAISMSPNPVMRTNYAVALREHGQKEQALEELKIAAESDQQYYGTHLELGKLLEEEDAQQAFFHLEKALHLAPDPLVQTTCLEKLLAVQEKLDYFAGAMISIKRLIDLNPTSYRVSQWKDKFALLRWEYETAQRDSESEEIVESGEASLAALARNALRMGGWSIDRAGLQWIRAVSDRPGLISPLLLLLLDVPQLTETLVQERIAELQNAEKEIQRIALLTTAEIIDRRARIYLAQCHYPVAIVASVELREAIMKDEHHCNQLLRNAIDRADKRRDPFRYTKMIQERSEFFGRVQLKEEFTSLILRHELIGLYGIHKIGKSSFLRQVCQHLALYEQHITPIWVEMNASLKNPADLYRKILEEAYRKEFEQTSFSAKRFQDEFYTFWKNRQRDYARHQVLLILDEYPYLIPGRSGERGMRDYMEVLELFKVLSQDGWFNFLPCGRTTALSRLHGWAEGQNPFIGMIQERFLEPLTREEVEELIYVLGIKVGIEFKEDAIESIWALAGGHPLFTRTLGSCILERSNLSSHGSSVSVSMVDNAVKAFLRSEQDITLLKKIYQKELEEEEQRIVKILATSGRPRPRNALILDNASEEDRMNTRLAVENLLATSVLKEDNERRLSHRYELLRLVILQDIEEDRFYRKDYQVGFFKRHPEQSAGAAASVEGAEKPRSFFSLLRGRWGKKNS